ncbi:MAG: DUF11 domain-containing protein [Acidobacteriota bacterium]
MNHWKVLRTVAIVLAIACLLTLPATAQTAAERAELAADAAGNSDQPGSGSDDGGIVCTTGSPTDFYFSDFEADGGGFALSAGADWERGAIVTGVFENCDMPPRPEPAAAPSGSNVWANNLDGCYDNANAESILSQTFDFSSLSAPIELTWENWYEVFVSFDMGEVLVNGDTVFSIGTTAATGFVTESADLSAYAGLASVTIEFRLFATSVVNRMGMYIDDVRIATCGGESELEITKSDDSGGTVMPGGTLVYTLEVTNNGPDDDSDVVVTDMLPAEVTYVSDDCGALNVPPWTWNVGTVMAGGNAICNITVTVDGEGPIVNTATVTGANSDDMTGNNASTITTVAQASVLEIPTLGTLGLVALILLLLGSATLLMRRRT